MEAEAVAIPEAQVLASERTLWLTARRQSTTWVRLAVPPLAATALLILVWYCAIWAFSLRPLFLPTPRSVVQALGHDWRVLLDHSWVTIEESVYGLGLAVGVGVILAVLISEVPVLSRALMPLLVVSQAIPKVAIAPLFVIWLGFGLGPKILVAFFVSFFPIVVSTAGGLRNISRDEIELFKTMTPRRWPLYRHLKIYRALPQFFDGAKVASSLALIGAIVGEFISADHGLGYLVTIYTRDLKTPDMFAVFVALSIVGILLFYAVVLIERLVLPWHFAMTKEAKVKG